MSKRTKGEPTLKDHLLKKFRTRFMEDRNEPVHSQKIGDFGHELGYKHETVGRMCRTLAEKGLLKTTYKEMKNVKGATVWYSYVENERDILVKGLRK